jgi:23S rRNA (cytidine1920-2'-O)/16S rRNA (cytidine1409-2'-O)-methyltransferase
MLPRTPHSEQRADLALVERGFFESRAKAQEAIAAGLVRIDGKPLRKPSEPIGTTAHIEAAAPYPWVSRGGVKLDAALDAFGFHPRGAICLDVGASTGGFTDVLLARGAAKVYAVDVGHKQLHARLAADPRVVLHEAKDARSLVAADFAEPPGFITCDVSFISSRLVLPTILALAAARATLVSLIKPQFEVGRPHVVKGIVKDAGAQNQACARIETLLRDAGWQIAGLIEPPIQGAHGNQEFLIGAVR